MNKDYYNEAFKKISEEKRQKILNVAIDEFSEHGFESANINSIAQKCGISVGSIYKYFDNKEHLFLTVVHFGVDTLRNVLNEIIAGDEKLENRIEKIIRAIQKHSRSQVSLTRLYNEMSTESRSNLVWKISSEMESATAELYTSFIEEAQKPGEVRPDADPKLFAFFLDNLFISLQFSYSCEYYKQRMKIFTGVDIFEKDELVAEQLMKFIKGAFFIK